MCSLNQLGRMPELVKVICIRVGIDVRLSYSLSGCCFTTLDSPQRVLPARTDATNDTYMHRIDPTNGMSSQKHVVTLQALYAGLKRLREDARKASLCLAHLPDTVATCKKPHEQLRSDVHQLFSAVLMSEDALNVNNASVCSPRAVDHDGMQQPPQEQKDGHQPGIERSDHASNRTSLYRALDQLQQAAGPVLSSARAAARSGDLGTAVDMPQLFDILMSMAESVYQAQSLLRQYADTCAAAAAAGSSRATKLTNTNAAAGEAASISNNKQHDNEQQQGTLVVPEDAAAQKAAVVGNRPQDSGCLVTFDKSTQVGGCSATDKQSPMPFGMLPPPPPPPPPSPPPPAAGTNTQGMLLASGAHTNSSQQPQGEQALNSVKNVTYRVSAAEQQNVTRAGDSAKHQLAVQQQPAPVGDGKANQNITTAATAAAAGGSGGASGQKAAPAKRPAPAAQGSQPQVAGHQAADVQAKRQKTDSCHPQSPPAAAAAAGMSMSRQCMTEGFPASPQSAGHAVNLASQQAAGTTAAAQAAAAAATPTAAPADGAGHTAAAASGSSSADSVHRAVASLIQQLASPRTAKQAARKLADKARMIKDSRPAIRASQEAIKALLALLYSKTSRSDSPEDHGVAAVALRMLVKGSPEGQTAVAAGGGIQRLLHVISHCRDEEDKYKAVDVFYNLIDTHEQNARAAAAIPGCIAILCQLLQDPKTAAAAGSILAMVAVHCSAAAQQLVVDGLVSVLKDSTASQDAVCEAATALGNVCDSCDTDAAHNRVLLAAAGGIQVLVKVLQGTTAGSSSSSSTGNPRLRAAVTRALGLAVVDSPSDRTAAAVAAGAIEPLVQLLLIDNADVQTSVAHALFYIMTDCDDHMQAVAAAGGGVAIAKLVQLLSVNDNELQYWSAFALGALGCGSCAAAAARRERIVQAGGMASLITLLSCSVPARVENPAAAAAFALMTLAQDATHRDHAGQAIQTLLRLLTSSSSHASGRNTGNGGSEDYTPLEACTGALLHILEDNAANQEQFVQSGGVAAVVNILKSCKDNKVLLYSTGILYQLAFANPAGGSCSTPVDDGSGFMDEDTTAGERALRSMIAAAGAVQPLVTLLESKKISISSGSATVCDLEVLHKAAGALWNIAYDVPDNTAQVVQAGAVPLLVQILGCKSVATVDSFIADAALLQQIRQDVAGALATLAAGHPEHQAAIAAEGGIKELVALLNDRNSSSNNSSSSTGGLYAEEQAAHALAALADTQSEAIVAAGAVPLLISLLHVEEVSNIDDLHERVADALAAICRKHPQHGAAVAAYPRLLDRMRHLAQGSNSEQVRQAAASAVAVLQQQQPDRPVQV